MGELERRLSLQKIEAENRRIANLPPPGSSAPPPVRDTRLAELKAREAIRAPNPVPTIPPPAELLATIAKLREWGY